MNIVAKNTKHLAAGSACPPLQPGLLRIYSMFYCPYAQRTRIILNLKNVKHETVNVHLRRKPEWLFKANPLGKVPVLQLGDKIMYESMITCNYLNDAYPDPPLYSSDPWARAVDEGLIAVFESKVIYNLHKIYRLKDEGELKNIAEDVRKGLIFFEEELNKRETKFFFGNNRPGMIDYCLFPWFERFTGFQSFFPEFELLSKDRYPSLYSYSENMHKDPAAKSTLIPIDDHIRFLKSFKNGEPNYDIGCEEGLGNQVSSSL